MSLIAGVLNDNLGSPSIYMVSETVKEWLLDNNAPGQDGSMYADMLRRQQQKDVEIKKKIEKSEIMKAAEQENNQDKPGELEKIRKHQQGNPVTLESFNAWKENFEKEQFINISKGVKSAVPQDLYKDDDRPTGKQLFMMNKAGKEDALLAEAEAEVLSEESLAGAIEGGSTAVGELAEDEDDDDEDYVDEGEEDEEEDD